MTKQKHINPSIYYGLNTLKKLIMCIIRMLIHPANFNYLKKENVVDISKNTD